jgi:SRSO17 transposase
MQGQRYWVERAFEDAKGQCGLADYQVQGWLAWHHHVTMVARAPGCGVAAVGKWPAGVTIKG